MRVLSAMQPSGLLHLGNYFGSIVPNLALQGGAGQVLYFIADLHALTTMRDAAALRQYRCDMVLDYLACGFDPEKSIMFYQSDVPAHTELLWVLSTVTPVGLLERAVSYKEKVVKNIPATAGLFLYPVLMAADILLYGADTVPVGKDQKQHLEMARDIALKFNNTYGDVLVVPHPLIRDDSAVVPGVDGQKMSKSYGNTILLFGSEADAKKAIMRIVTDSRDARLPKDPEHCIIFQIHRLFLSQEETDALAADYRGGLSYGEAKERLWKTYVDVLSPLRQARDAYAKRRGYIEEVMEEGRRKAAILAEETMERVRQAVGL